MNYFTKEDLDSILSWANVYTEFGTSWTYKLHKSLIDRILFMIDNYCDHHYSPIETLNMPLHCLKCGRTFE